MLTTLIVCVVLGQAAGDKLDGAWKVASVVTGRAEIDATLSSRDFVFDGAKFKILKTKSVVESAGTFILRSGAKPKEIDLVIEKKDGRKVTVLGIYALDGKTLKLAISPIAGARPNAFDPGGLNEVRVYELKRAK